MRQSIFFLVLFLVACTLAPHAPSSDSAPASVARAGGFSLDLETVDGGRFSFEEIRGRKHLVAAFWATWCDPCKTELRHLAEIYPRFSDTIAFVAVSTDGEESMDKVRAFAVEQALPFPILVDPAKKQLPTLLPGGDTVPYLLIVDRTGAVVAAHTGYEPGDEARLVRELEDLRKK